MNKIYKRTYNKELLTMSKWFQSIISDFALMNRYKYTTEAKYIRLLWVYNKRIFKPFVILLYFCVLLKLILQCLICDFTMFDLWFYNVWFVILQCLICMLRKRKDGILCPSAWVTCCENKYLLTSFQNSFPYYFFSARPGISFISLIQMK